MSDTSPLPAADGPVLSMRLVDGIPIVPLPEDLAPESLREHVRAGASALAEALGGRPCRLDLGAREIELFQVRRLIQLLRDPHGIEVTGLIVSAEAVHHYAERELKLDLHLRTHASEEPTADEAEAPDPASLPGMADVLDALGVDEAPAAFLDLEDEPTEELQAEDIEVLDEGDVEPLENVVRYLEGLNGAPR